MPSVGEGPLLNVARVAKAVGLTEATIRRWALEGLVPGVVRLGRTIRFDPADLILVSGFALDLAQTRELRSALALAILQMETAL